MCACHNHELHVLLAVFPNLAFVVTSLFVIPTLLDTIRSIKRKYKNIHVDVEQFKI